MRNYVIVTDSDTEIPYTFADAHQIPVFLMPYTVNGEERLFDLGRNTDFAAFYQELRDGAEAVTSTRPPIDIADFFRETVKDGTEVLYLCFSSALSGHYELSQMAKSMVLEEFPDARIEIVDTLRISMGAGQLVMAAQKLKEEGKNPFTLDSKEPTASFQDFINSEIRYKSLAKQFPEEAEKLFAIAEKDAKERYAYYKKLAEG